MKNQFPGVEPYKDQKDTYTVRISLNINGRRIRETYNIHAKSAKKAYDFKITRINEIKAQYEEGVVLKVENMTFNQLVEKWREVSKVDMDRGEGISPTTYNSYNNIINTHLIPYFNFMPVDKIRSETLVQFLDDLKKKSKERSASTNRNIFMVMRTLLRFAKERGFIRYNPALGVKIPAKEMSDPEYFDEQQIVNILAEADKMVEEGVKNISRDLKFCTLSDKDRRIRDNKNILSLLSKRMFIYFCIFTGCRRGEVIGLNWKDITLEENTIKIVIDKTAIKIKGEDSRIKGNTKNKTTRGIYIDAGIYNIIKEYKVLQSIVIQENGWDDHGYVFITLRKGPKFPAGGLANPDSYTNWFKKWCVEHYREIGISLEEADASHPHTMRHTFATYNINNGTNIKVISELLGHNSTQVTLDIYSHVYESKKKESASLFSEIIQKKESVK